LEKKPALAAHEDSAAATRECGPRARLAFTLPSLGLKYRQESSRAARSMLHCPNESRPVHVEPEHNSFFVDAILRVANDWLIRDYVQFLPNPYTCGDCGAQAFDDEE
jgi:hypothetical protein